MAKPGCAKHPTRAVISCTDCYSDDILQAEITRLGMTAPPSAPTGTKRPKRMDSPSSEKKRKSVFDQLQ